MLNMSTVLGVSGDRELKILEKSHRIVGSTQIKVPKFTIFAIYLCDISLNIDSQYFL